jgi:hypothetical protein
LTGRSGPGGSIAPGDGFLAFAFVRAPAKPGHQTREGTPMTRDPLFLIAAAACLAVLVILMIGIGGFAKGGDFNRKHANRIMRLRIIAQAIAVALILVFVLLRSRGGV